MGLSLGKGNLGFLDLHFTFLVVVRDAVVPKLYAGTWRMFGASI